MDRQTFLMVTGLAMVGAVSSCTLDARDESAPTPAAPGDTGGGTNDGASGATDGVVPECREDFDCCADPTVSCGRECRDEQCDCAAGFLDLNGTDADGCEYACHVFGDGTELPNGRDDNCDGATDEGFACAFQASQPCGSGTGICQEGMQRCVEGVWSACEGEVGPQPEVCNGLDDDCDGLADDGLTLTDEVCDAAMVDEDCDGEANEGCDCADGDDRPCGVDPTLHGVGVCRFGAQVCVGGIWSECVGAIAPSDEVCNSFDDDCDGTPDDGFAFATDPANCGSCGNDCRFLANVLDAVCAAGTCGGFTCRPGFQDLNGDPEDGCEYGCFLNNGGTEACNSLDDDCDGDVDETFDLTTDATNCGACGVVCSVPNSVTACVDAVCIVTGCDIGYALVGGSCLACDVWPPPAAESCDAEFLDEDCDGLRNETCACVDGASAPCGVDLALHGVGECRVGVQTCSAGAFGACSGAVAPSSEVCNGLDDDCDGSVPTDELDADGDGVAPCAGDCDDGDASVFPGGEDICNLMDDDCDGAIDEFYFVGAPCNRGDSFGASCQVGVLECDLEFPTSPARCSTSPDGSMYPLPAPAETCDNLADDDCDGSVDEGCGDCDPDTERPCGLPSALNGVGECRVGVQTCGGDRTWGSCIGAVAPSPESCNSLDDDCDGATDDGFDLATDAANCGACGNDCTALPNVAVATCAAGVCGGFTCRPGFQDLDGMPDNGCEYGCFPTNGGVEQCDGIDNDCDGAVDDDPSCTPSPTATDTVTFAVTLPEGFPIDASRVFCSTFVSGTWTCGDFTLALGSDGRTLTTSGTALTGPHVFNLCTSACDDPVLGTWVVIREPDGSLSQAAVPTMTFAALPVVPSLVRNARGTGGNWFAELALP